MKKILFVLTALFFSGNAFCGSTDSTVNTKIYHVNRPVVGAIIGVGMIADYVGVRRIKNKPSLSIEEIHLLNTQAQIDLVNPFDRWALRLKASDRDRFNKLSNNTLAGIALAPCLLLIDKDIRKDWVDILLMYSEGHTITLVSYCYNFLGPTFVSRYRPRAYYPEFTDLVRESGQNRNSFYSGHVASAAYSTFFMAKVYCDYHPNLGAGKYLIYTAATIPPLLMSYLRIKALDHFPSDNAIGLVIGAAIGIIVPELHKYPNKKNISLGMFSSPEGMGLSINWKFQPKQLLTSSK